MAVDSVSTADAINYVSSDTATNSKKTSVDTDTFLKLLVAQLKYQDPLEPQKDTAFVTQLAQMTSLEEMQQMNATLQNSQAYDMVGKEVYAEVLDEDTGITNQYLGVIDSVIIKSGIPFVVMGNTAISVSDVKQVFTAPETDTSSANDSTSDTILL